MNQQRAIYLLKQYAENQISDAERVELSRLINEDNEGKIIPFAISEGMEKAVVDPHFDPVRWQDILAKVVAVDKPRDKVVKTMMPWRRLAVAASITISLGIGSYFLFFNKTSQKPEIAKIKSIDVEAPQHNKAVITLADGTNVVLDSSGNGTIAQQDNVKVVRTADGEIVYQGTTVPSTSLGIQYNTLSNPRGSNVINLTLADGSKVWLNAESSLKYPTAFVGDDRKVEITGEAYFEVAHDPKKKFLVGARGITTEVLGTHFNINAYADEDAVKTTLLEGSVKVSAISGSKIIKPGQQAVISFSGDRRIMVQAADLDEVLAWKNGKFNFLNGTNIMAIMRQVSRWYDVEVEYKGDAGKLVFSGKMSRKENASKLLEILKATATVDFKTEDRKITVISK